MEDTPIAGYRFLVTNPQRLRGASRPSAALASPRLSSWPAWPRSWRTRISCGTTRSSRARASPRCCTSPPSWPIGAMWLLDVNLPSGLLAVLRGYGISCDTTANRGWRELTNGLLAEEAFREGFRVTLTRDRLFEESARRVLRDVASSLPVARSSSGRSLRRPGEPPFGSRRDSIM